MFVHIKAAAIAIVYIALNSNLANASSVAQHVSAYEKPHLLPLQRCDQHDQAYYGRPRIEASYYRMPASDMNQIRTLCDDVYKECYMVVYDTNDNPELVPQDKQELVLISQELHCRIPKEIGLLRLLTYLNLHTNHLNGPIPESICCLSNLQSLILTDNELSGDVPLSLAQLKQLRRIHLSLNPEMTGPLTLHGENLEDVRLFATSLSGLNILNANPNASTLVALDQPEYWMESSDARDNIHPIFTFLKVPEGTHFTGRIVLNGASFNSVDDVRKLPHLPGSTTQGRYAFINPSDFLQTACGVTSKVRFLMNDEKVRVTHYQGDDENKRMVGELFPFKQLRFKT